ncbi:MAG: class I SAM-dependent methyltransferase, partial [Nannocystaceae bacterium]
MDPVMLQLAARAREDRATVAAAVSSEPAVMALGDQYAQLRCPDERRREGATYTPRPLVTDILERDISLDGISRIVDLGAGTGRFLLEAATHAPSAQLWAVEPDPVARMILWIRASELGLRDRLVVSPGSFHELRLPSIKGRTAFVGNPPYVRHHHIDPKIKAWARTAWEGLGLRADLRAGLHVHALAAIATQATQGDRGALLLPVEWMRVNYGRLARALCVGTLGLRGLTVYEPRNSLFKDAFVSSVVTGFTVGSRAPWVYVRAVDPGGARVATRRLLRESLSGADG